MKTEIITGEQTIREGYTVLLRYEKKIELPGEEKIRNFQIKLERKISDSAFLEAEKIREKFRGMTVREKAAFRPARFGYRCRVFENDGKYLTLLCETVRGKDAQEEEKRTMVQVWNLTEQTLLPPAQVLRYFEETGKEGAETKIKLRKIGGKRCGFCEFFVNK